MAGEPAINFFSVLFCALSVSVVRFLESGDVSLQLTINGEERDLAAATVLALLEELGLNPQATVVEQNGGIVDRAAYQETPLIEGDVLELVRIVGGG